MTVAQKTGFASFRVIVIPLVIADVICFLLTLILGLRWLYILPAIFVFVLSILLRFHVIEAYEISNNKLVEFCTAFFCCPCSIAQSKYFLSQATQYLVHHIHGPTMFYSRYLFLF